MVCSLAETDRETETDKLHGIGGSGSCIHSSARTLKMIDINCNLIGAVIDLGL